MSAVSIAVSKSIVCYTARECGQVWNAGEKDCEEIEGEEEKG